MKRRTTGPIPVHGKLLRPRYLATAQNHTAQFVWPVLRRYGSYLIADEVGAGKSYIALSLAFGLWRSQRPRKPCFRILILAAASELNHSWLLKLVGRVSEEARIGTLAQLTGENSYTYQYLRPEMRGKTPQVVVFHLRGRHDSRRLADALKYENREKARRLDFRRRHNSATVEFLVTSPSWVQRVQKKPKAADRQWVKWLKSADVLIADEIFGARNDTTIYGRVLRPKAQDYQPSVWKRRRPRLIGLSATLLSRDLTDARSILSLCLDWRRATKTNTALCDRIEEALNDFSRALRTGLRTNSIPKIRQYVREYKRQKTILEKLLPHLIVRTFTRRPRSYRFLPGGHNDISLFDFSKTDSTTFPVDGQIGNLLSNLQSELSTASDAPGCLKWFISEAKRPTSQSNGSAKLYPAWTSVTESYKRTDESVPTETHPKLGSLRLWIEAYYKECEAGWLQRVPCPAPHFKLLVYVHHVRTATALNPRSRSKDSLGKSLRQRLRRLMLGTCRSVARHNAELFRNKNLDSPVKVLQRILEQKGWNISRLKRANPTLLLAACINAHKGRNRRDKLDRFRKTIEDSGIERRVESYRQVLRRYPELRRIILDRIGYPQVLAFETGLKKEGGKFELTPSVALLDPTSLDLPAIEKKRLRSSLEKMEGQFRPLIVPQHLKKRALKPQVEAIVEKVVGLIERHSAWGAEIAKFVRAPYRNLEKIRRQVKIQHRIPWELAIQTGEESKSRDFVADSFRTVGNPFVLVLTNVCTVGVDLHTYCWDVLHYTPAWTPHEAEQKTGRIDRPRLRKDFEKLQIASEQDSKRISVHHLIWPHTYDERILSRLNLRAQLSERLLGTKHQDVLEHSADILASTSLPQFKPLDLHPPVSARA